MSGQFDNLCCDRLKLPSDLVLSISGKPEASIQRHTFGFQTSNLTTARQLYNQKNNQDLDNDREAAEDDMGSRHNQRPLRIPKIEIEHRSSPSCWKRWPSKRR